jgi:Ca2+-binding EF-hand superfamily protein
MGGKQSAITKKDLPNRFGLTNQQYDDLKAIFRENSKGRNELTRQEFRKVYSGRLPGNVTKFADKMFDCFDTDGNGTFIILLQQLICREMLPFPSIKIYFVINRLYS